MKGNNVLRKLMVGLVLSLMAGCYTVTVTETPVVKADTHEQQFGVLRQATVRVEVLNHEGATHGVCSGVVVRPHVVLTAAHCDGGEGFKVAGLDAVKIRKDEVKDLMLMYVEKLSAAPIGVGNATPDEAVVLIGYPLDLAQVLTEGRMMGKLSPEIIAKMEPDEVARAQLYDLVTAPAIFGNSGGPVFALSPDGSYQLVGIVSAIAVAGGFAPVTHLTFVVCTEAIRAFLTS